MHQCLHHNRERNGWSPNRIRCLNLLNRPTLNQIRILIQTHLILILILRIRNHYLSLRQNSFRSLFACCWSRNH